MKNSRKLFITIAAISLIFVIIQMDQPRYFPQNRYINLDNSNTLGHVITEKGIVAISGRILLFATPEGRLINTREVDKDGAASEPRIIETDGEYIYADVLEVFPDIDYMSAEKIVKYTFDGTYLGELYRKEFDRSECRDINTLKDIEAYDGKVYITEIENDVFSLISTSSEPSENGNSERLFTIKAPEYLQNGDYQPDEERLVLYNEYGEAYFYDPEKGTLSFHPEITKSPVSDRDVHIRLSVSRRQVIMDIAFYIAFAIVVTASIVLLISLGSSGFLMTYRTVIIFGILFVFAVGYYTNMEIGSYKKNIESKIRYTIGSASVGIDLFMKDALKDETFSGSKDLLNSEVRSRLEWLRYYINELSKSMGYDMAMYTQIYLFGEDNEMYLVADSYDEYPLGTKYTDMTGAEAFGIDDPGSYDVFLIEDEADGSYALMRHILYDENGRKTGFLEIGSEYGKLRSLIIENTVETSLQLLAFIFFLYVLFDTVHKYRGEIHDYIRIRKTDPDEARISLSNTYDYIVSFLMYIDSLIMVKAVVQMVDESAINLAIAFAIPFTAYRIGSSLGSLITSSVIGFWGERKAGIISSSLTVASFVGMGFCIIAKNIYIFAVLKFIEGIFLESILFSISEGVPYEIEDDEYRNRKILESQSASSAANLTALMAGGIIAEYISYTAMYVFCGLLAVVLVPMSMMILRNNDEEDNEIKTLKVWKFFLKPRPLSYIIFIVFSISLLYGYDEFVFPLISENSGISGLMLSSIGVLTCAAAYFGEGIPELFKGQTPLRAMIAAFTSCGVGLLIVLVRPSILIAVLALININVFERVIDNFKIVSLIELNNDKELDNKDIQENYYAIEDTFRILHGPLLGSLSVVSSGITLAVLAAINLISPRIYDFLNANKEMHSEIMRSA